jgi:CubicO group peptidase (beta-lactamase class C family)
MNKKFQRLDEIVVRLMRKFRVPGLALSIIKDGERIYEKGYGARNLEENLPMTEDTLIGIGSISKSFTAMLILQLQEKGLLTVEDSVSNYLNVEPFISHQDITISHLLSHSSGIPSADAQWLPIAISYGDYKRIYPVTSRDDYLQHISELKDEIFFNPGEKFFYNNDMFTLLGIIIEKLTGKSFETVLQQNILNTLKMSRSTVNREKLENDPQKNYIRGYLHKGEKGDLRLEHPKLPFSRDLQAPGGIYTSMHELSNYAKCLLQKGKIETNQIISPQSIELLWKSRILCPYGYGKEPKYCFGWVKEDDVFEHIIYHHGGGLGVSTSFLGVIPDLNLGINIAENDDMGIAGIVGMCAFALMLDRDPIDLIDKYRNIEIFCEIEGKYRSSLDLYELEVFMKNQSIYINVESDDGRFTFPLIAEDYRNLIFRLSSTVKYPIKRVQFFRDEKTEEISFISYDRYLYHKN